MARCLIFRIQIEEGLYYPCSENKGADQLRGYSEADLRLVFSYAKIRFSHDGAHVAERIYGALQPGCNWDNLYIPP